MIWMAPIGAMLAVRQFLLSLDPMAELGIMWTLADTLGRTAVIGIAMIAELATPRRRFGWAVAIGCALLVGSGLAIAFYMRGALSAPPRLHQLIVWSSISMLLSFTSGAGVGVLNCVALRLLGCRFVRPNLGIGTTGVGAQPN